MLLLSDGVLFFGKLNRLWLILNLLVMVMWLLLLVMWVCFDSISVWFGLVKSCSLLVMMEFVRFGFVLLSCMWFCVCIVLLLLWNIIFCRLIMFWLSVMCIMFLVRWMFWLYSVMLMFWLVRKLFILGVFIVLVNVRLVVSCLFVVMFGLSRFLMFLSCGRLIVKLLESGDEGVMSVKVLGFGLCISLIFVLR